MSERRVVPLTLFVRRLAPFVATGLIRHSEAVDTLMESALERGLLTSWDRATAAERWLSDALTREAEAWATRRRARQEAARKLAA